MMRRFIITAVIAAAAVAAALLWIGSRRQPEVDISRASVAGIDEMVRLCTMEVYSEVPVMDTIGSRVLFGIQKQQGSISFPLDKLEMDTIGDTIRVTLPREHIEILESTEPDAWEVIDTKAIGPMGLLRSDRMSIDDENRIKEKARRQAVSRLYADGTVAQARRDASVTLARMLTATLRRPVTVVD